MYIIPYKFFLFDVASTSDTALLQNADVRLTSNSKEDILILEAKLQECSRKINDKERQLARKREDIRRVHDETKMKIRTRIAKGTTAAQLSLEKPLLMPVKGRENRKLKDTKLSFEAKQTKATVAMQQKYEESIQNPTENQTEMDFDSLYGQFERASEEFMHSTLEIHVELWEMKIEVSMLEHELHFYRLEQEREMQILHRQTLDALEKKIAELENKIEQIYDITDLLLPQTYGKSTPSIDLGAHRQTLDALAKKVAKIENKIQQLHVRSLLPQTYGESTPSIDLDAHSKRDDQH